MTREEQLKFCAVCKNRSFDAQVGITCGLTNKIADFEVSCPDYIEDDYEKNLAENRSIDQNLQSKKRINRGRIAIFVLAALYVFVGFKEAFWDIYHDIMYGIIDWGIAAIFIGIGIWSYYKPFPAFISGLVLYVLTILLVVAFDPSTILSGIIWKVIIILALVNAIKEAKNLKLESDLNTDDLLDQF